MVDSITVEKQTGSDRAIKSRGSDQADLTLDNIDVDLTRDTLTTNQATRRDGDSLEIGDIWKDAQAEPEDLEDITYEGGADSLNDKQKEVVKDLRNSLEKGDIKGLEKTVKGFSENPEALEPIVKALQRELKGTDVSISLKYSSEGAEHNPSVGGHYDPLTNGRHFSGNKDYGHVIISNVDKGRWESELNSVGLSTKPGEGPTTRNTYVPGTSHNPSERFQSASNPRAVSPGDVMDMVQSKLEQ